MNLFLFVNNWQSSEIHNDKEIKGKNRIINKEYIVELFNKKKVLDAIYSNKKATIKLDIKVNLGFFL